MSFNYSKICSEILKRLPDRQKQTILRRFGLQTGRRETLQALGNDFGITRERVRQIEKDAIERIRPKLKNYQKVLHYFNTQLKKTGGLRKEDIFLSELGGENYRQHIFFLLSLAEPFTRFAETAQFYSCWAINHDSFNRAKKFINSFYQKLIKANKPLLLSSALPFSEYFLEISKIIQKNSDGLFGLKNWPEINPSNIKDKAFVVLKKSGKPLHFRDVASLIGPDALIQTVHNELIRDQRFVLVGRGLYALREWGFKEGDVKDVILEVLKEAGRPLSKEDILEKVSKQRFVKKNTILLNLNNQKCFLKTPEGKYSIQQI